MNALKKIIIPTTTSELTRKPYILFTALLYTVQLLLLIVSDSKTFKLTLILVFTYLHINISAQRARNSGLQARYVVILSLVVYILSTILIGIYGNDCMSIGARTNLVFDITLIFLLALAPPAPSIENNMELNNKERK